MSYFGKEEGLGTTLVTSYAYPSVGPLGAVETVKTPFGTEPRYTKLPNGKCFDRKLGKEVYMSNCDMQSGQSKLATGVKESLKWLFEPFRQALTPGQKVPSGPAYQPTFWDKYKTPITIGGIATAVAGGVYLMKKKG